MPQVIGFEDLDAWKKARELAKGVYRVTSAVEFSREFGLKDQMRRAVVSVASNIAEGFERGGDKEFRQFLAQAKGSAGEVRCQLCIAADAGLITPLQFAHLTRLAMDTGNLIGGLMRYLSDSPLKGHELKD